MNYYIENEVKKIYSNLDFKDKLIGKTILITGGTGLIGSFLIRTLSKIKNAKIIGTARDEKKVKKMIFPPNVEWLYLSLRDTIDYPGDIDYIIHTASPTDSSYFINSPVELINDTIIGLNNLLTFSKEKCVKSVVFLSSLEVYGICTTGDSLTENEYYSIDCTNVRNSYSEGKRLLECLCCSYFSEYNVPVKIVRLGQTFGMGVDYDDNRVFSQFAKKIVCNENIVLKTKGETKRSYCSIIDAVNGIVTVLLNGENSNAYNLASDNSYSSIFDLARLFCLNSNNTIEIREENCKQYLETIRFELNTDKIKRIGFISKESLADMVNDLKQYFAFIRRKH